MRSITISRRPTPARHRLALALLSCIVLLSNPVAAQSNEGKVLSGKAVTESNLVDALTPAAAATPSAAPGGAPAEGDVDVSVKTRSLRVTAANSPAAATLAPRKKASASLLITFETNSSALTTRSKEQLDVVAAALRNDRLKDFNFDVEGHADSRGNPEQNRVLSQQRAESVRMYLVTAQNIPQAKLRAIGKGDTEPMNVKDVAAAENRRVTIVTNTQ